MHPDDLTLKEFVGTMPQEHLSVWDHLVSCKRCRQRVDELKTVPQGPLAETVGKLLPWPVSAYDRALDSSLLQADAHYQNLAKERDQAGSLFEEIVRYPPQQRNLLVSSNPRFKKWGLFEFMVDRVHEATARNPIYAEDLGFLALLLSESLDPATYGEELIQDLRGRVWAYIGNARRVRDELEGAEEAFEKSDACFDLGSQDPFEQAIYLELKASLRRSQLRFEEALRLSRRAKSIFRRHGQDHRVGRVLVKMSAVYHMAGDFEAAIALLHEAQGMIDVRREPRLMLCVRHNLIDDLAEMGRFREALDIYRATRQLYSSCPESHTQNQRKWVRGKIARGLGQYRLAEILFESARNAFETEGKLYDAGLVSLELATLYTLQGRASETRPLAFGLMILFSSLQIQREAMAALILLRRALEL